MRGALAELLASLGLLRDHVGALPASATLEPVLMVLEEVERAAQRCACAAMEEEEALAAAQAPTALVQMAYLANLAPVYRARLVPAADAPTGTEPLVLAVLNSERELGPLSRTLGQLVNMLAGERPPDLELGGLQIWRL